ncbi:unnamed protein product [Ixodes persulcatus]
MTQEKPKDDCSPRSRSSSDASKSKEKKDKSFLTKVVIRRLPPTMSEDQFLDQISPVPENDYMYFVKGNKSLGPNAFSRAYINFINQDEIFIFKEKFDEYVFLDEKGNEYPAIVEYAPFQKIPKRRTRKKDPKCGTIEQDPEYLKFLESLEQPEEVSLPSIDTYIEEIESREKEIKANNGCLKVVTPLIEYLQQRKLEKLAAQKLREERREERKRREVEKKRLRDEEKRRRKVDRERSKDSSVKDFDEEPSQNEAEAKVVKVLRNPVREQDPPSSKESGVVPKVASTPGPSKLAARSTTASSTARKEWDRPKSSRPLKDYSKDHKDYTKDHKDYSKEHRDYSKEYKEYPKEHKDYSKEHKDHSKDHKEYSKEHKEYKEYSKEHKDYSKEHKEYSGPKYKSEQVHRKNSTGSSSTTQSQESSSTVKVADDERPSAESSWSSPAESRATEKDRDRASTSEETSLSKQKDPRAERRIRNKDRPSIEIYRPGMRRGTTQKPGSSSQDDAPSSGKSSRNTGSKSSSAKTSSAQEEEE